MNKRNTTYTRVTNIAEHIYQEAENRARKIPIHKKSHRKDEANGIGCLGELIAECWMDRHGIKYIAELDNTVYDYKLENNLTIDVKTKDRRFKVESHYDNSAPLYNHEHQKPDYFLFVSLERNKDDYRKDLRRFHTAHIVGSISYNELDRIGLRFLEGEKDWRNHTKFWTDCLNIEMWQLISLRETVDLFKGIRQFPSSEADLNVPIIQEMNRRIDLGEYKPRSLPCIDNIPKHIS